MITTVVFDLDDTLYDEIDYCRSGFTAVSQFLADRKDRQPGGAISAETFFEYLWNRFNAGDHTTTFNAALDNLGISYNEKFIQQLVHIYREHQPQITLPPDSKAVLDTLRNQYTLAMLTDGFLPAQQLKVRALGIADYFRCIIYTELLGREFWKPSPEGFRRILEKLNTQPENCVYIADNAKKDFIGPNELGFETIQLTRPNRLHKAPPPVPADGPKLITKTITVLPQLLQKL